MNLGRVIRDPLGGELGGEPRHRVGEGARRRAAEQVGPIHGEHLRLRLDQSWRQERDAGWIGRQNVSDRFCRRTVCEGCYRDSRADQATGKQQRTVEAHRPQLVKSDIGQQVRVAGDDRQRTSLGGTGVGVGMGVGSGVGLGEAVGCGVGVAEEQAVAASARG